jgi:hypothetical protein
MRPIEEWDEEYVVGDIANLAESENFERKESAKVRDRETLAKAICAFANAGDGILAFGVRDARSGGGLDDGVEQLNGREPIDSWVNALIPKLLHPPIENCRARFIPISTLGRGRGVLAVQVPLSDRRPHWSTEGPKEVAYLRVGEHSAPMRLQTLLDISTRGAACIGEIGNIEIGPSFDFLPPRPPVTGLPSLGITPIFRVKGGPICRTWALEMVLQSPVPDESLYSDPDFGSTEGGRFGSTYFNHGDAPLFPGKWTRLRPVTLNPQESNDERELIMRLFLESSIPVQSAWKLIPSLPVQDHIFEAIPLFQNRTVPLE